MKHLSKHPGRTFVLFACALALGGCRSQPEDARDWMNYEGTAYAQTTRDGRPHSQLVVRRAGTELLFEADGEVEFTAGDRDFVLAAPGSSVSLRERSADGDRIWTAAHGEAPRWSVNGQATPVDDEAREWLAEQVRIVARESLFGAEKRADRLLESGGVAALVEELEQLRHPRLKALYLERIREPASLPPDQIRIAVEASTLARLSSSARARLYLKVAHAAPEDRALTDALLMASRPLPWGQDQVRVLRALAERSALDDESAQEWLQRVAFSAPNSQRVELLLEGLPLLPTDDKTRRFWLRAAREPNTSAHQETLLTALACRSDCSAETLRDIALHSSAAKLSSGARARVLKSVMAHPSTNAAVHGSVLDSLQALDSAHETANVLLAMLALPDLERGQLERIAQAADGMASSSERERVRSALIQRLLADAAPRN
jgi:hypothetical protein